MSITAIIPALADVVDAEIELDLAQTAYGDVAQAGLADMDAVRLALDQAEAQADLAYIGLTEAVANAPDSRAKSAIAAGIIRSIGRCLDAAVVPPCSRARPDA